MPTPKPSTPTPTPKLINLEPQALTPNLRNAGIQEDPVSTKLQNPGVWIIRSGFSDQGQLRGRTRMCAGRRSLGSSNNLNDAQDILIITQIH